MTDAEPLLGMQELADYLGMPLQTLYAHRKHGRGPKGFRIGGRIKFKRAEVDAWLETQREAAPEPRRIMVVRGRPA